MGIFNPSFFVFVFPTMIPLTFVRPITHGADHLHTAPLPRLRPLRPPILAIRTLNIWDGRGFGLAQAILMVESGLFHVMILTETKISMTAYCRNRM